MNVCRNCKHLDEDRSCEKIHWGITIEVERTEAFGEYGRYWEEHEVTGVFPNQDFCCIYWEESKGE